MKIATAIIAILYGFVLSVVLVLAYDAMHKHPEYVIPALAFVAACLMYNIHSRIAPRDGS